MTEVTSVQKDDYEKKRNALMVPDPWTDVFCAKNGLVNMYIESSIAEIMHLRAESEPGVKLNCPNPIYIRYHSILDNCLQTWRNKDIGQSERVARFTVLLKFLENEVLCHTLNIVRWADYVPDIRLVNTIDEAIGWLAHHLSILSSEL